jgi:hypothetical protein
MNRLKWWWIKFNCWIGRYKPFNTDREWYFKYSNINDPTYMIMNGIIYKYWNNHWMSYYEYVADFWKLIEEAPA